MAPSVEEDLTEARVVFDQNHEERRSLHKLSYKRRGASGCRRRARQTVIMRRVFGIILPPLVDERSSPRQDVGIFRVRVVFNAPDTGHSTLSGRSTRRRS